MVASPLLPVDRSESSDSTGTLLARPDGDVVHASAAALAVLGAPSEEIVGSSVRELCSPDDRSRVADWIERLDEDPGPEPIRFASLCRDGGVAESTAHRSSAANGTVVIEVARHHHAGPSLGATGSPSTLEDAVRMLERANENLRSGIDVSLDPGALLSPAVESVRTLVHDDPDGAIRGSRPVRSDTLLRLGELSAAVEGFVALSKAGSHVDLQPLSADQLIADVLADARTELEEASAVVVVAPAGSLMADRWQVGDALARLIDNAVRFRSPERPLRIEIRVERSVDRRVVVVSDNGRGMPHEQRSQMFEMTGDAPPPGFGLAICRRVVAVHGGTMRIDDGIDGGIAVKLEFPHWGSALAVTDQPLGPSQIS